MKKILVVILILFITGCNSAKSEKITYDKYIKKLKSINNTSDFIPFNVETRFDKLIDSEVRYQVIIDNVKENIYDVEALAIHNKKTEDVYPSIGIFDDKQNLLVDKKPAGIILVGYIDYKKNIDSFKCELKVMIKYKTNDKKEHIVYYVTKK